MHQRQTMVSSDLAKQAAGIAAANLIQNGWLVGLGTGSTARFFIEELAKRFQQGLHVRCVATSAKSWLLGLEHGLPMLEMAGITSIDMTVDGADEIDPQKNMIKGGGGALLREKILASISAEMVVVVDNSKLVSRLGGVALPVEVAAFGFDATLHGIRQLGFSAHGREDDQGQPYMTDGGNQIIDVSLKGIKKTPHEIDQCLRRLPGVLQTGFFFGLAGRVIIGQSDGTVKIENSLEERGDV